MKRVTLTTGLFLALAFGAAACGGDGETEAASSTPAAPAASEASADGSFVPACSAVPAEGRHGSFDGMAGTRSPPPPPTTPLLSTLVTAVKKAGLVDTLNTAQDITVFAPTNDAFAKIPKADLNKAWPTRAC